MLKSKFVCFFGENITIAWIMYFKGHILFSNKQAGNIDIFEHQLSNICNSSMFTCGRLPIWAIKIDEYIHYANKAIHITTRDMSSCQCCQLGSTRDYTTRIRTWRLHLFRPDENMLNFATESLSPQPQARLYGLPQWERNRGWWLITHTYF